MMVKYESEDDKYYPCAEADAIEQQVIDVVSNIPKWADTLPDSRTWLSDFFDKFQLDVYTKRKRIEARQRNIREKLWSREITARLATLGEKLGYDVIDIANASRGTNAQDWMYDLIWREYDGDEWTSRTHRVPLILECNWWGEPGQLHSEPLERLLLARAEHRVMVCEYGAFPALVTTVENCGMTKPNDRYLLLSYIPSQNKFEAFVYVAGTSLLAQ